MKSAVDPTRRNFDPKADFSPAHVIQMFDDMAKTYGAVNLISSLGFSHLWRKACVRELAPEPGHACADLMCGMGEATSLMVNAAGNPLRVDAIDFCPEMTKRCEKTLSRKQASDVSIQTQNVFDIPAAVAYDRICCSFGLKTLDDGQAREFARLIKELLRPEGRAAFVEIHVPENRLLRMVYLFYIRHFIPFIGRICLGDPNCYRHLAVYTEDFAKRDFFGDYLKEAGLQASVQSLFFGCARLYIAELR
jgi:ubiquinone/menaquinone biosynthesis methyltransferase